MRIIVKNNIEQMAYEAGKIFIEEVKSNNKTILGLATGSTPIPLYNELIRDHKIFGTDYSQVKSFNLDEYVGLDPNSDQSYRYFMEHNLFNKININKQNTNLPDASEDTIDKTLATYDKSIEDAGGIDIQILGIGSNGHIAFNEPGSSFESTTHVIELDERTRLDNARFFDSIDDVPKRAITMGIATIMKAKKIVLLANGRKKAKAIFDTINGPVNENCPASILQNHPDVTIILDEESASLLNE